MSTVSIATTQAMSATIKRMSTSHCIMKVIERSARFFGKTGIAAIGEMTKRIEQTCNGLPLNVPSTSMIA